MDIPIYYLDNTILSAWEKCRLSAILRYGLGYDASRPATSTTYDGTLAPPRPNLKLLWGSAAHEAVATWLTTRNVVDAAAAFADLYHPAATTSTPDDDRYTWENSRDILGAWLYHQQAIPSTFTPHTAWVESHLETRLTTDAEEQTTGYRVVFVSRPDAVGVITGRHGTYTMETKTTGQRLGDDWAAQWAKDSQLTSQIWSVWQHTGQAPTGALVNAIGITRLPSGPTKCTRGANPHHVPYNQCRLSHAAFATYGPYTRTPEALETWRTDAVTLAKDYLGWAAWVAEDPETRIAAIPETGAFNAGGACRFCEWREWCVGGKDVGNLEALSRYNPWNPRLGSKGLLHP